MFLLLVLLFSFVPIQVSASSVSMTVFVHGSYPALKLLAHEKSPVRRLIYAEPGLHLAKNLPENYHFHKTANMCNQLDSNGYCKDHFYTYGWNSSNLRPANRYQEGQQLFQAIDAHITKYVQQGYQKVYVRFIGSSHGGNVVLNALQWLPFATSDVEVEVILMGTPVQEETRDFINSPYVARAYSFYSVSDWMQKIDIQKFHKNCPKDAPFFSQRTFLLTDHVVQVQLYVNSKSVSHGQYRTLFGYLPKIIQQIQDGIGHSKNAHVVFNFEKK